MKKVVSWVTSIGAILGIIWLIFSQIITKEKKKKLNKDVQSVENGIHNEVHAAKQKHEESERQAEKAKEINDEADKKIKELEQTNPTAASIVSNWNSRLRNS